MCHHGPLYGSEGGLESSQLDSQFQTLGGVSGQLLGHGHRIDLPTQRGSPLIAATQGGGCFIMLGIKLLAVFSEDLGDHVLKG